MKPLPAIGGLRHLFHETGRGEQEFQDWYYSNHPVSDFSHPQ